MKDTLYQSLLSTFMYKDRLAVYRLQKEVADDFSDDYEEKPYIVYKDIPCKLSKHTRSITQEQTARVTSYKLEFTLFLDPDKDIRENDILEIKHQGQIFKLRAGTSFKYSEHQEVNVFDSKEMGENLND